MKRKEMDIVTMQIKEHLTAKAMLILQLLYLNTVVSATLLSSMNNVIAKINSSVNYSCTTNITGESICWSYGKNVSTTRLTNNEGQLYKKDKLILNTLGNPVTSTLTVNAVQLTDAGSYSCYECFGDGNSRVELTVFVYKCDELPPCVQENASVEITCNVSYTGRTSPVVLCRFPPHIDTEAYLKSESQTNTTGHVTYKQTMSAALAVEGDVISCHAIWADTESYDNLTIWESSFNFTYGPRNVRIQRQDDTLTCSADGSPPPTYQWITDSMQINGSTLSLGNYCNGDSNITVTCTATVHCHVSNRTSNATESVVCPGLPPIHSQIMFIATVCLVIVAIAVTAVVIWYRRQQGKRGNGVPQARPDVVPSSAVASAEAPVVYAEVKPRDARRQHAAAYSEVKPRHNRIEDERPSEYAPAVPVKLSVIGASTTADDGNSPIYAELAVQNKRPKMQKPSTSHAIVQHTNPVYADISHLAAAAARAPQIAERQKALYANYEGTELST